MAYNIPLICMWRDSVAVLIAAFRQTLLQFNYFEIVLIFLEYDYNIKSSSFLYILVYMLLLVFCYYCIEGLVIAAQCTATFSRSIVLP